MNRPPTPDRLIHLVTWFKNWTGKQQNFWRLIDTFCHFFPLNFCVSVYFFRVISNLRLLQASWFECSRWKYKQNSDVLKYIGKYSEVTVVLLQSFFFRSTFSNHVWILYNDKFFFNKLNTIHGNTHGNLHSFCFLEESEHKFLKLSSNFLQFFTNCPTFKQMNILFSFHLFTRICKNFYSFFSNSVFLNESTIFQL